MRKIIVIVGPTASGKSAFAVEFARMVGGEIISADSRQVYTGLDIGTGKITKREMKNIPHHLLDIASPKRMITAHDFAIHARKAINEIVARGKVPIVVGGTGFYIDALVGRISLSAVPMDKKLRARLLKKTPKQLFALLTQRDPKRAASIAERNECNNKHRLIRALEITYGTLASYMKPPEYRVLWIGIKPDMQGLKKKIRERLVTRIKKGMFAEAKRLQKNGLSYIRMNELGLEYRYLALYLQGKISKEELVEQLSAKIWQYARRQVIYWKRNKDIQWDSLASLNKKKAAMVRDFLER
ncbi:tRNA (adenosine(37)-N6)-dimethylallyltransferase MiaA [Candidatus Kaiserbacteria bacterium]|nr:tRNA (adenosine(37)-N6)-dimethylallyltransferase MiaA [Candidatus Kaiserbacteria bacterium]